MNEIRLDVRLVQKHNTFAYWSSNSSFIPLEGEIIVYTDHKTTVNSDGQIINIPDFKVGDGVTAVGDLPFLTDDVQAQLDALAAKLDEHINDSDKHLANGERANWNKKVSCRIDGEQLILE